MPNKTDKNEQAIAPRNTGKRITFEYEGESYTLMFTRETIKEIEGKGFSLDKLNGGTVEQVAVMIEKLKAGAFFANHRGLSKDRALEIINSLDHMLNEGEDEDGEKEGNALLKALGALYQDPYEALINGNGKNVKWEKNW